MSLSDKILNLLKQNPALSSEGISNKLKEQGVKETKRTIQRHLKELLHNGLIQNHAIGREIVYSLSTSEAPGITDYFLSRFWTELFEISKEIATQSLPGDAYKRLRTLVMLLPKNMKDEVMPAIKSLDTRLNVNGADLGITGFGFKPNLSKSDKITHSGNLKLEIEPILDKLSTMLHEKFREKAKEGVES